MNSLVEKMFGILMFLAMFVPFQLGMYSSYMDTWEFTQVTSELNQMIQEEGGLDVSEKSYDIYTTGEKPRNVKYFEELITNHGYQFKVDYVIVEPSSEDERITVYNNLDAEEGDTVEDGIVELATALENNTRKMNPTLGDRIIISYEKDTETTFGWKPNLQKTTEITIYKR